MEINIKQLRIQPGRIISEAENGQEITITYRGKPRAKIVPIIDRRNVDADKEGGELFGIWKNREDLNDVNQFIRNARKGRVLC